jgi:CRP-like cAMP-binding protein
MTAQIRRLVRRDRDQLAGALRLVLLNASLTPGVRTALNELLLNVEPDPWAYFMTNPISHREIIRRITRGERPRATIAVWNIALTYAEFGAGREIRASREQIADDANTTVAEVSRAMNRLAEIGALIRLGHGRFCVHPQINWIGPLDERKQAVARLELVEPA